jgi:hypothetical protein
MSKHMGWGNWHKLVVFHVCERVMNRGRTSIIRRERYEPLHGLANAKLSVIKAGSAKLVASSRW